MKPHPVRHPVRLKLPVLLPVLLAVLAGCAEKVAPPPEARPVRVVRAVAIDGQAIHTFAAEVKARYETDMSFRVAGKILSREVDAGTPVKRGQVLARLDSQDANLNAAAARANLVAAESELDFAKAELARYEDLLAKKFVSQGVYDQKLNAHKAAVAKRDAAKAQSSVSGNQAVYFTLVADADGVVTAVNAEAGQVVNAGQAVMRVARLGEKDAVINIGENQLAAIKSRPAASIALWANPGKLYAGKVREIGASADPVTRTYTVKVKIHDADDSVRWGMSATVGFAGGEGADNSASGKGGNAPAGNMRTILLPMTALTQTDDKSGAKPAVWVVGADGKVKLTPVQIGPYAERGVPVLGGLAGGELVVTAGVHKLQPGQTVKPLPAEGDARAAQAEAPASAAGVQSSAGVVGAPPAAQVDASKASK